MNMHLNMNYYKYRKSKEEERNDRNKKLRHLIAELNTYSDMKWEVAIDLNSDAIESLKYLIAELEEENKRALQESEKRKRSDDDDDDDEEEGSENEKSEIGDSSCMYKRLRTQTLPRKLHKHMLRVDPKIKSKCAKMSSENNIYESDNESDDDDSNDESDDDESESESDDDKSLPLIDALLSEKVDDCVPYTDNDLLERWPYSQDIVNDLAHIEHAQQKKEQKQRAWTLKDIHAA